MPKRITARKSVSHSVVEIISVGSCCQWNVCHFVGGVFFLFVPSLLLHFFSICFTLSMKRWRSHAKQIDKLIWIHLFGVWRWTESWLSHSFPTWSNLFIFIWVSMWTRHTKRCRILLALYMFFFSLSLFVTRKHRTFCTHFLFIFHVFGEFSKCWKNAVLSAGAPAEREAHSFWYPFIFI